MTEGVIAWRLYPRRLAEEAFTGAAASKYGGRWNLPGTRAVYFAESRALAALESLVHVEAPKDLAATSWLMTSVTLKALAIERPAQLPPQWNSYPYHPATQHLGTKWAQSRATVALRVPSAVVAGEFNYLLNPEHPDFSRLKLMPAEPFRFDPRFAR